MIIKWPTILQILLDMFSKNKLLKKKESQESKSNQTYYVVFQKRVQQYIHTSTVEKKTQICKEKKKQEKQLVQSLSPNL